MLIALAAGLRTSSPVGLIAKPSGLPRSNSSSVSTVQSTGATAGTVPAPTATSRAAAAAERNRERARIVTSFLHVDGQEAVPLDGVPEGDRLLGDAAVPHPVIVAAGLRPGHDLRDRGGQ